jgi:hypothetical protein
VTVTLLALAALNSGPSPGSRRDRAEHAPQRQQSTAFRRGRLGRRGPKQLGWISRVTFWQTRAVPESRFWTMLGWSDFSCLCSRSGDNKRQSRIGDTSEKPIDRRGTQTATASRGMAGHANTVLNESLPVRQELLRPGMGLVPSQEPQITQKYVSTAISTNVPASNFSPHIPFVPSKPAPDNESLPTTSSMKPECNDMNFDRKNSQTSYDENTIRFSV